jgi:cytochrome d ubiquinol oxidase subunit II
VLTAALALFPFLMPSSSAPNQGLTIWDASSSAKTLLIMFVMTCVFLPIILAYTSWVFGVMRGRVTLESIRRHGDLY